MQTRASSTRAGGVLTMDGPATSTSLSYRVEEERLHLIGMSSATGQSTMVSDIVAVPSP
jgi:hypothetical protein